MKIIAGFFALFLFCAPLVCQGPGVKDKKKDSIALSKPDTKGKKTLEQAISSRRSVRWFLDKPVNMEQVGQLLWAGQGITDEPMGFRAAPSAGAIYPLELFAVIPQGVYKYLPESHSLKKVKSGDVRESLGRAALNQRWVKRAPLVIVIAGDYARTTRKYRVHGKRYVHIEVGHAAQNIHLQAVTLGLSSVPVGAFPEDAVRKVLSLPEDLTPLYLIPVGFERE